MLGSTRPHIPCSHGPISCRMILVLQRVSREINVIPLDRTPSPARMRSRIPAVIVGRILALKVLAVPFGGYRYLSYAG